MPTDKSPSAIASKALLASQMFAYPDLEPSQKLQFERAVAPFDLELEELVHLLSTRFPFDKQARHWLERYVELSQLYLRQEDPVLDPIMARWVKGQRLYRQRGRMPLERERAFNRIGFVWKLREESWQKQYEECRVLQNDPQAYDAKKRAALRVWLSVARKKFDRLSPQRQRLLQEADLIRPPFAQNIQRQVRRNTQVRLQELEAFFARQGHLRGIGESLGRFVYRLRQRFQAGTLSPEEQKRCNQMGLKWFGLNPAKYWLAFYARAAAYVQQCGVAVPPPLNWPDTKLSKWVGRQTARWDKLSDEQKHLLEKLQIKTQKERYRVLWDRKYAQVVVLHARLGPYRERVYQDEDAALKRWLLRQTHRWDLLSEEQREQLKAIGLEKRIVQPRRVLSPE